MGMSHAFWLLLSAANLAYLACLPDFAELRQYELPLTLQNTDTRPGTDMRIPMETEAPRPLTTRERQLVELASCDPPLTDIEIAERMGTTATAIKQRLIRLRRKGRTVPDRRGRTRPEPDWHAAAILLILSYRATGMAWTTIGRQLGRSGETVRKLFLQQVQDRSQHSCHQTQSSGHWV